MYDHLSPTEAVDDPILDRIAKLATLVTGSPHSGLHFFDEALQHRVASDGAPAIAWPREDAMCRLVVEGHEAIEVADATLDERFEYSSFVDGDTPVRYYASHPIVAEERAVIGTVCVWDDVAHEMTPTNLEALGHLAALVEDRLESLRVTRILAEAATTDPLTGLGNRRAFLDVLGRALAASVRHGRTVSVLFVDLDGFKQVNDTLGHEAGDEILAEVARRLDGVRRQTDMVARLGGDEFVVFLDEAVEPAARKLAGQAAAEIERPILTQAGAAAVGASIGVATATPDDTADGLIRRADLDMYRVKRGRRS